MDLIRKLISCSIIRVSTDSSIPQMNFTSFGSCFFSRFSQFFWLPWGNICCFCAIFWWSGKECSSFGIFVESLCAGLFLLYLSYFYIKVFSFSSSWSLSFSSAHHRPLLSPLLLYLLNTKLLENIIQMLIDYIFKINTFILS